MLFLASGVVHAKTVTALSPSLADVSRAISSAADGDTIVVPAGTASWTSSLVITKGITLQGQTTTDSAAGTAVDKTIIQDNVTRVAGSGGNALIRVESVLGKTYRISGLTFAPQATVDNGNGMIKLRGNSHAVRLDHCNFQPNNAQAIYVGVWGAIYGVADHNVMKARQPQIFSVNMDNWPNPNGSPGVKGHGSWAAPTGFGTEKFWFIEDNYIANVTSPFDELAANLDSTYGGRWVFRYNHCYETEVLGHGTIGGAFRGYRAREIYGNDFHYAHQHPVSAGGSGVDLWHDNKVYGIKPSNPFVINTYRVLTNNQTYGGGGGKSPWDSNDTKTGSFSSRGFIYNPNAGLYDSGTTASVRPQFSPGVTQTITVSAKNWTPGMWTNFAAIRLADGTISQITGNTSNTLTLSHYSDDRNPAKWIVGDRYEIRRPLVTLDQPGRGQGDLLTASPPINSAMGAPAWPNQALEPDYSWNNKFSDGSSLNISVKGSSSMILVEGRDFYNNTPMPGYKPYLYPHPLTSDLAPPSDLTIVP